MMLKERKRTGADNDWMNYLVNQRGISFTHTGCVQFDCALGGGWAGGRIINIVGDRSTGKTLLAIEACANFARDKPKGLVRYREMEGAFDNEYARLLGMPLDRMEPDPEYETVEEMAADLDLFAAKCKKRKVAGLYVVDSLDAMSDKAELARKMGDPTYGGGKAKGMSEMFRRLKKKLMLSNVTLVIISQIRDNIGVTFGRKWSRSGGKALDFYASQIVYLAEVQKIRKTSRGMTRVVGVRIKASVQKNKCGLPFREAEFVIKFGYGIDDRRASEEYLTKAKVKWASSAADGELADLMRKTWIQVEQTFLPKSRKYAA